MLLSQAKQIVCISKTGERFKFANPDLCVLENSSVAINEQGVIVDIGDIDEKYQNYKIIDCRGRCVLPGLIDAHTHPCYAGDRSGEFKMKLEGATYMEIHNKGGGIMYTSRCVNQASQEELEQILESGIKRAIRNGTTTMEAKSGFGLSTDGEVKQLLTIEAVSKRSPIEIVQTYLGAHALPPGLSEKQAEQDVIQNQIPQIKKLMDEDKIHPEFVDVFCEKGIYEIETTKNILQEGAKIGLIPSFHGEELNHLESAKLGADLGAIAISHLEHLSQEGIKAMAEKKVVGVILPTTQFILKLQPPPVREMIDSGVPTALATDYCPNAYCMSLPFTMSLACLNLKMRPNEALCAVTLNAAAALNRHKKIGSIEVGKQGDFVILDAPTWEHLIYQIADSPIWKVIKKGKIVYEYL
ncbi:unnamed protein product [Paramecium octaurelia]|uniref:Probable imidazolonepropionase n=1 Tax=Paramecium octaurelia TaxID=43137 RepID=A0A8S1TMU6_PAROT|nr:unnamed protein product [Paramecium octaurelia]